MLVLCSAFVSPLDPPSGVWAMGIDGLKCSAGLVFGVCQKAPIQLAIIVLYLHRIPPGDHQVPLALAPE